MIEIIILRLTITYTFFMKDYINMQTQHKQRPCHHVKHLTIMTVQLYYLIVRENKKISHIERIQLAIPDGVILSRTKVSCSGSFLKISAAIGSGWTPCRSPDILWDRIILEAAKAICSPLALMWSGRFSNIPLHSGPCTWGLNATL